MKKFLAIIFLLFVVSTSIFAAGKRYIIYLYFHNQVEPEIYRNCTDISYVDNRIYFTCNNGLYSTEIVANCEYKILVMRE